MNDSRIERLSAGGIGDALVLYQSVPLPHCWPVLPEAFARAVKPAIAGEHEAAWLCYADNCPVAFAHVCDAVYDYHGEEEQEGTGGIRFLYCRRGYHRLAAEMLARAEAWLVARDLQRLRVMHCNEKYPFFHVRHTHLPGQLDHIHALLSAEGYAFGECEMAYEWVGLNVLEVGDSPVSLDDVDVRHVAGAGARPNIEVRCSVDGDLMAIGMADSAVSVAGDTLLPGHVCDPATSGCGCAVGPSASDVAYIKWLQVDEALQGRGLGKWTLLRTLEAVRDAGYTKATICVIGENYRPWQLYSGMGFQLLDWSWTRTKGLTS